MGGPRHLRWVVGDERETARAARDLLADYADVLDLPGDRAPRANLGGTVDAAVLNVHAGFDPDALAVAHGLVRAGGALVVRAPPAGPPALGRLACWPYTARDVGRRVPARLMAALQAAGPAAGPGARPPPAPGPGPAGAGPRGPDQAAAVDRLRARLHGPPGVTVLLADRGRGKSATIGLALGGPAWVSAPSPGAAAEVFRFSGLSPSCFVEPAALARAPHDGEVVVIDEAAGVPIPLLRAIVLAHPRSHLVLATTTGGYEGTGQGFRLRVLPWLAETTGSLDVITLEHPIRWDLGDPLEAWVRGVLLLDAPVPPAPRGDLRPAWVDRDGWAQDETALRGAWALLAQAHYRSAPSDLAALLDAPNLRIGWLAAADGVAAINVLAEEGGWTPELALAVEAGHERVRGHALPDTLTVHAGCDGAGRLRAWRSVRLVVHPGLRGRGLAGRLSSFTQDVPDFDLDGTLFAGQAPIVRMRQRQGFVVVRVGTTAGERSGEPAVVMVRPRTPAAVEMVRRARGRLARGWPLQRAAWSRWHGTPLDVSLEAALAEGLPEPPPWEPGEVERAVRGWAWGPRPVESVGAELLRWLETGGEALLPPQTVQALRSRLAGAPWAEVAAAGGWPSVPAAMRELRRSVAAILPGDPR